MSAFVTVAILKTYHIDIEDRGTETIVVFEEHANTIGVDEDCALIFANSAP
jgi:hypothetical protein